MIYSAKSITLKDGSTAILRAPEVRDARTLIDLLKTVYTETHFLSSYPEEITLSLEDEEPVFTVLSAAEAGKRAVGIREASIQSIKSTLKILFFMFSSPFSMAYISFLPHLQA